MAQVFIKECGNMARLKSGALYKATEAGYEEIHPLVVNRKDGSVLVQVPAGEFEMGDGKRNNCHPHRVYLDMYYIGVYAVTNRQYKLFTEETGHRAPGKADYGTPIWKERTYSEQYADHPVVCVNREDALAYCRWAGGSLPTEAQWEKAARGPKGLIYPWGREWDGEKCRHSGTRGSRTTCEVYGYGRGGSGYGCYNMSGNVWEWCMDWYGSDCWTDSDYYRSSPHDNPPGANEGSYRVNRGGSWYFVYADYFRGACRGSGAPAIRCDYGGFRLLLAPGQQ